MQLLRLVGQIFQRIQLLGDWNSDAYKRYLALSLQDKIQVSKPVREYIVKKPSVKLCDK